MYGNERARAGRQLFPGSCDTFPYRHKWGKERRYNSMHWVLELRRFLFISGFDVTEKHPRKFHCEILVICCHLIQVCSFTLTDLTNT
jgi:hypothetical protein